MSFNSSLNISNFKESLYVYVKQMLSKQNTTIPNIEFSSNHTNHSNIELVWKAYNIIRNIYFAQKCVQIYLYVYVYARLVRQQSPNLIYPIPSIIASDSPTTSTTSIECSLGARLSFFVYAQMCVASDRPSGRT